MKGQEKFGQEANILINSQPEQPFDEIVCDPFGQLKQGIHQDLEIRDINEEIVFEDIGREEFEIKQQLLIKNDDNDIKILSESVENIKYDVSDEAIILFRVKSRIRDE